LLICFVPQNFEYGIDIDPPVVLVMINT